MEKSVRQQKKHHFNFSFSKVKAVLNADKSIAYMQYSVTD